VEEADDDGAPALPEADVKRAIVLLCPAVRHSVLSEVSTPVIVLVSSLTNSEKGI